MDDVTILSHQISIDPPIKWLIPGTVAFGRRHKSFLAYEVGLEDNWMSNLRTAQLAHMLRLFERHQEKKTKLE